MLYHEEKMIIFSETYINSRVYFCRIFGVYMYWFATVQEIIPAKLPAFFQTFLTEERVLTFKALKLFRILIILWVFPLGYAIWSVL